MSGYGLPPKVEIAGVPVSAGDAGAVVKGLLALGLARRPALACFMNAHSHVTAQRDPRLKAVFAKAAVVAPDGMPLVWALRSLRYPAARRATGTDVALALAAQSSAHGLRHYLWGGAPGVAARVGERLRAAHPRLTIAGVESPPCGGLAEADLAAAAARIRASRADYVWVGIGAPRQELAMARLVELAPCIYLGVGAAFDFLAGTKPRAPLWAQTIGLEWAHRLATEPRRLAGRYLVTSPQFLTYWLKELGDQLMARVRRSI